MPASASSSVFGTAYYPDHWPEPDWSADLARIADAGLGLVRFGEFSWSWYEPAPGRFDFSAFDRFVDLVEARGLSLCLCTPTATPPPWFDLKYPDGRLLDMQGRRCLSHRHFWSWTHPASRAHAGRTIVRLARRYAGRPCLWGWQIDNEPNYAEEVHPDLQRWYDFSPHARAAFVAWLRARYDDSLDALNAAWWGNFWSQRLHRWEEAAVIRGAGNPHAWLDFLRWREASQAEFVRWQADILRGCSPGTRIGCNIPETGVKLSVAIGQDYFAQARGLDWVGTDLYQATGDRPRDLAALACSTDLMRGAAESAGADFVISETQGGPHERAWPNSFAGEAFPPDYLEASADVYGARGARQVWWFLWRPTLGGQELGMNGVQALDGTDTPRTAVVRELAGDPAWLKTRRDAFRKRPRVWIHYSRDSLRWLSRFPPALDAFDAAFIGWHALIEACGFRVDYLDDDGGPERLADSADPLVLPLASIADDRVVAAIAGHRGPVLAGPHTAFTDNAGRLRPHGLPPALVERFGVNFGVWHDTGALPTARGLPALAGYREFVAPTRAHLAALSDGHPLLAGTGNATVSAADLGDLWMRATKAQKARLVRLVAPRLGRVRIKASVRAAR